MAFADPNDTPLASLQAAYVSVTAQLAALLANPQPTVNVGERTVSWTDHYRFLTKTAEDLRTRILELEDPWEFTIQGLSG